jgi:flagellar biosynthesis/type III secretory pathway protein FliH
MGNKYNKREEKCHHEDEFECMDEIDEMDCCSDEKKDYFIDMIEEIYKEGFERGCKQGYKKAIKEVLEFMKKNKCCIKCSKRRIKCSKHRSC